MSPWAILLGGFAQLQQHWLRLIGFALGWALLEYLLERGHAQALLGQLSLAGVWVMVRAELAWIVLGIALYGALLTLAHRHMLLGDTRNDEYLEGLPGALLNGVLSMLLTALYLIPPLLLIGLVGAMVYFSSGAQALIPLLLSGGLWLIAGIVGLILGPIGLWASFVGLGALAHTATEPVGVLDALKTMHARLAGHKLAYLMLSVLLTLIGIVWIKEMTRAEPDEDSRAIILAAARALSFMIAAVISLALSPQNEQYTTEDEPQQETEDTTPDDDAAPAVSAVAAMLPPPAPAPRRAVRAGGPPSAHVRRAVARASVSPLAPPPRKLPRKIAVTALLLVVTLSAAYGGYVGLTHWSAQRALAQNGWIDAGDAHWADPYAGNFEKHVCAGDGEAARLFLRAGMDANGPNGAPLGAAARAGCVPAMVILLEHGAKPDGLSPVPGSSGQPAQYYETPFVLAAKSGHRAAMTLLAGHGANLAPPVSTYAAIALIKFESAQRDQGKPTPDTISFLSGLKLDLVAAGPEAPGEFTEGDTPLLQAIRSEDAAAVQGLVALGADVTRPNKNGEVPWLLAADLLLSDWACWHDAKRIPDLEARGVREPAAQDKPARDVAQHTAFESVMAKVSNYAQTDGLKRSGAHYLARDIPLLKKYMDKGLPFEVRDSAGLSAWDFMSLQGLRQFIIERPDLAQPQGGGRSALQAMMKFYDADPAFTLQMVAESHTANLPDKDGGLALLDALDPGGDDSADCAQHRVAKDSGPYLASGIGSQRGSRAPLVQALLKAGSDPQHIGPKGRFPLMYAHDTDEVRLLVMAGANPALRTPYGDTLAQFISERQPDPVRKSEMFALMNAAAERWSHGRGHVP